MAPDAHGVLTYFTYLDMPCALQASSEQLAATGDGRDELTRNP